MSISNGILTRKQKDASKNSGWVISLAMGTLDRYDELETSKNSIKPVSWRIA